MNERERKVIAFLLNIIFKLCYDERINENDTINLCNLMSEFGSSDLDEQEFRY